MIDSKTVDLSSIIEEREILAKIHLSFGSNLNLFGGNQKEDGGFL